MHVHVMLTLTADSNAICGSMFSNDTKAFCSYCIVHTVHACTVQRTLCIYMYTVLVSFISASMHVHVL